MLNQLTLICFRKHQSLVIDFTKGIQVIRAANEGGKTTLLEGIGYALFGAKSLRTTFDQAVTWGEDVKRLKVSLTLTVDDAIYTFTRGKSGAEVLFEGKVFVTGQGEVTSFAARLLGADSATANKLMLAGQNSIRGTLEEGPKALSQMIEDLAGFSTFDQIFESASSKLALGSSVMVEDRLARAEASLVELLKIIPLKPNIEAHEKTRDSLQTRMDFIKEQLPSLQTVADDISKKWREGSALYLKRVGLQTEVSNAYKTLKVADTLIKELMPATKIIVDLSPIEGLKEQIVLSLDHSKRKTAYRAFKALPTGEQWEGSRESFLLALKDSNASLTALNTAIAGLGYELKSLKANRFDSDMCSKCGQKLPNAEDIAARNVEVDKGMAALAEKLNGLTDRAKSEYFINKRLKSLEDFAARFEFSASRLMDFLVLDVTTYPGTATWNGPVPSSDPQDVAELRRCIEDIEAKAKAVDVAKAKLELAVEQRAVSDTSYRNVLGALDLFIGPNEEEVLSLTNAKDQAINEIKTAETTLIMLQSEIEIKNREYAAAYAIWSNIQNRVDETYSFITECKEESATLAFNNALVKKLRAIRPTIANKLWNTVLASVSVMFSTMRKDESWVTKEGTGFTVNGQPMESLSGSTLDVLGLAIRCTMLRTFLPQCGLLVLDEPMHGCDDSRAEAMLGFLKSVNFQQTLLVSHEKISETVADNLIIL